MKKRKKIKSAKAEDVQRWFRDSVTYEGEPYLIDLEQAEAVVDASLNTIVVARAGSGKTRTLVAKIVYLIAKCGVRPDEIMAFVFNANAAREINERLSKMLVKGTPIMGGAVRELNKPNCEGVDGHPKIASTFHAFSRRIVFEVCGGKDRCGKILAGEKEAYIKMIVREMTKGLSEDELATLSKQMASFVNRAQQQFLNGENTLAKSVTNRLAAEDITEEEQKFVQLGVEVYRRYHWYLLRKKKYLPEYGTDFNLIVSWASKLIAKGGPEIRAILAHKKYILIDEYQDFSQLFLSAVMAIRRIAVDAKLFVVGDDWQAINRFAGSEVEYFKNFEGYFGDDCRRLEISTNYRCDYEIVDAARRFMKKAMKETGSFRANSRRAGAVALVNPKETELGFATVSYDKRVSVTDRVYQSVVMDILGKMLKKSTARYLKTVAEIIEANRQAREILILHRNNETNLEGMTLNSFERGLKEVLVKLGKMDKAEFEEKVELMTMHKSKGLEAEVVIILEADEGVIPKIHPDTNLYRLFGETNDVALDDQKRLFYVAMTRAKKRLYIIHDGNNRDGFIKFLGKNLEKWGE